MSAYRVPHRRGPAAALFGSMAAMLLAVAPLGLHAQSQPAVQVGVSVRPDTVTVGDPFLITVRVKVPTTAKVVWPAITDSTATIAPRSPIVRRDGPSDVSGREEFAEYQVAAWDTGQLAADWPDVLVVVGADTVPVSLADAGVYVRSVLSADTAQQLPQPPKPPFGRVLPWWQKWWPALLLLAALAWLAWARWRRGRASTVAAPVALPLGPYDRAMAAFDRVDRLALSEAGEPGRASLLAMEILRQYLADRVPATSQSHTSAELLSAVASDGRVPHGALREVVLRTDAVKFAKRPVTSNDAQAISFQARAIVKELEDAEHASTAAEAAASTPEHPTDAPPPTMAGVG